MSLEVPVARSAAAVQRSAAADVHAALLAIVAKERGVDADAARAILEGLKSEGRYLREIWS